MFISLRLLQTEGPLLGWFRMMDQRDKEVWELVESLWDEEYFKAGRAFGNAVRKKGIGAAYHVRDVEELRGRAKFDGIEIWLALTNANMVSRQTAVSRGCMIWFSGDANEGTVEQKKQVEDASDATLEWSVRSFRLAYRWCISMSRPDGAAAPAWAFEGEAGDCRKKCQSATNCLSWTMRPALRPWASVVQRWCGRLQTERRRTKPHHRRPRVVWGS
jgi:hypothetical protein